MPKWNAIVCVECDEEKIISKDFPCYSCEECSYDLCTDCEQKKLKQIHIENIKIKKEN